MFWFSGPRAAAQLWASVCRFGSETQGLTHYSRPQLSQGWMSSLPHCPVESGPVAVCLPSLLNLNNSKGSYTEGQLWYCLFFQKQNKTEGWELQKGSSPVDVRRQSKTAALLSNHQTLPRSRLSFRAVTPRVCTGAPVFQIKPRQPGGQGVACSVP